MDVTDCDGSVPNEFQEKYPECDMSVLRCSDKGLRECVANIRGGY